MIPAVALPPLKTLSPNKKRIASLLADITSFFPNPSAKYETVNSTSKHKPPLYDLPIQLAYAG
jgi:hypothetical protein